MCCLSVNTGVGGPQGLLFFALNTTTVYEKTAKDKTRQTESREGKNERGITPG